MVAHREASEAMRKAGLHFSVDEILDKRLFHWKENPRGDIDLLTSESLGGGRGEAEAGRKAYLERPVGALDPLPGAIPLLHALSSWKRALVTRGSPITQGEKIKLLGFGSFFDSIHIVPSHLSKKGTYQEVVEEWGLPLSRVVVVGDRPDKDIEPARRLGLRTIRFLNGEFREVAPSRKSERADAEVERLEEILPLLKEWLLTD